MTDELRTLNEMWDRVHETGHKYDGICTECLRAEAINWIKNLQGSETMYPIILTNVPDGVKGALAKDKWNDTMFQYGAEYGMIAMLMHFFNITEDDLK